MAEPIRFYMDQHFPAPITQGLRQRGIDVLTAQQAGRCGLPNADQLSFATLELLHACADRHQMQNHVEYL